MESLDLHAHDVAQMAAELVSGLLHLPSPGSKVIVALGSSGGCADKDPVRSWWKLVEGVQTWVGKQLVEGVGQGSGKKLVGESSQKSVEGPSVAARRVGEAEWVDLMGI